MVCLPVDSQQVDEQPAGEDLRLPALEAIGFGARVSDAAEDPAWDRFLVHCPLGQFQQSAAWARVKRLDGWEVSRCAITRQEKIVAGFQVLWKRKAGLRWGYVSKGPVVDAGMPDPDAVLAALQALAQRLHLAALVVQPPDDGQDMAAAMDRMRFVDDASNSVISANVFVDVSAPPAEFERQFTRVTRAEIRKTREAGVTVRTGGDDDVDTFFELMKATCLRQGLTPNPGRPEGVRAILREFRPLEAPMRNPACILFMAEHGGRVVAAELAIRFGPRMTLWKKGWTRDTPGLQPAKVLDHAAMVHAHEAGCRWCDFAGLARRVAEELLRGGKRSADAMRGSDFYKLQFGGRPVLLPRSRLWIPSGLARAAYRAAVPAYKAWRGRGAAPGPAGGAQGGGRGP
jgi:hypothetical protein